jgi:AMP phosphorylase
MQLKVKLLKWSAGIPVAMLNHKTAEKMGVHPQDRISIRTTSKHPKEISTIIDVVKGIVKEGEVAISSELEKYMNHHIGKKVEVNLAIPPQSLDFIKKKLNNKELSKDEIEAIIGDVMNNSLSEAEIALFIVALQPKYKTTMKELVYLTNAIKNTGSELHFKQKFVVDKHSIGGIPGNRTTPLVVSICSAAGLTMPKNSSRAITSAAGTADVMETIADVEFTVKQLYAIIKKVNACIVWGGGLGIVPADSKLMEVERSLKIDPETQMIASIMSKKLAAGSKYILIDIPCGKNAKISDIKKARRLKNKFEALGKHFGKKLKCVITNGNQPIGNGIGPTLELIDIVKILDPTQKGPADLEKKALFLAGNIFEMTGKAKKGKGSKMAKEILLSGKAFTKFKDIVKAQNGNLNRLKEAKFKHSLLAKKSGTINEINNHLINSLVRVAGCPVDKSAGMYLHFHVGDKVQKGQKIATLYAESKSRLDETVKFYQKSKPIVIK